MLTSLNVAGGISPAQLQAGTVGFLGFGNMARAMASGMVESKLVSTDNMFFQDPHLTSQSSSFLSRISRECSNANNAGAILDKMWKSDQSIAAFQQGKIPSGAENKYHCLILATKPGGIPIVLRQISEYVQNLDSSSNFKTDSKAPHPLDRTIFLSVAAGVSTDVFRANFPHSRAKFVRSMPNSGAMIGQSATAFIMAEGSSSSLELATLEVNLTKNLLSSFGIAVLLPSEYALNAVTGLSGSGPAYFYLVLESMIEAGVHQGLSRKLSEDLVLQTAKGVALLADAEHKKADGLSVTELREQVTSPGGTTASGLEALEEHRLRYAFLRAVAEATDKSRKLGAASVPATKPTPMLSSKTVSASSSSRPLIPFQLYFDILSPYSYFALEILIRYEKEWGIEIDPRPLSQVGIMVASKNRPPMASPTKRIYLAKELQLQSSQLDIPFQFSRYANDLMKRSINIQRMLALIRLKSIERTKNQPNGGAGFSTDRSSRFYPVIAALRNLWEVHWNAAGYLKRPYAAGKRASLLDPEVVKEALLRDTGVSPTDLAPILAVGAFKAPKKDEEQQATTVTPPPGYELASQEVRKFTNIALRRGAFGVPYMIFPVDPSRHALFKTSSVLKVDAISANMLQVDDDPTSIDPNLLTPEFEGKLTHVVFGSDRFELIAFLLNKQWRGPSPSTQPLSSKL